MDLKELQSIVAAGESETVELKKSTAQLPRAGESLCAFLNGNGGLVLIGVSPDGKITGQEVADKTQQEIARMLDRLDPPAPVETEFISLPGGQRSVVVLRTPGTADGLPFTYDGRPYRRVGTTTSRMPKDRYESLLLERMHARRRWENLPAVGVRIEDLDHEEILRTRDDAIRHRRISAGTSTEVEDILDRLGLRIDGELTQAAQMLYGTRFLPDYPQGKLKLGRIWRNRQAVLALDPPLDEVPRERQSPVEERHRLADHCEGMHVLLLVVQAEPDVASPAERGIRLGGNRHRERIVRRRYGDAAGCPEVGSSHDPDRSIAWEPFPPACGGSESNTRLSRVGETFHRSPSSVTTETVLRL
jgi:hypothetical protein